VPYRERDSQQIATGPLQKDPGCRLFEMQETFDNRNLRCASLLIGIVDFIANSLFFGVLAIIKDPQVNGEFLLKSRVDNSGPSPSLTLLKKSGYLANSSVKMDRAS
jgi:hypothetical protein